MRLIDADALEKEIKRVYCTGCNNYHGIRCRACNTDDALDMIEDAPTIDAEPVRHGRWVLIHEELSECSACGMIRNIRTQFAWTYCPNCGAKMDLEEE